MATVLIVEDDDSVREGMTVLWEDLGFDAIPVESASEALDYLKSNKPLDVLFTDIDLGHGMNGLEIASVFKATFERENRNKLSVLVTSGAFPESSVNDYDPSLPFLPKPYKISEFVRFLEIHIGLNRPEGNSIFPIPEHI